MKKLCIPAGMLLLAGIALLVIPIHMAMTGVVLVLLGLVTGLWALRYEQAGSRMRTLLSILVILAAAGVVTLMTVMSLISDAGETDWKNAKKADYAVVLGAGIDENGNPSRIMRNRLQTTMEFLKENPHAMVILSGGRGADEPISEAKSMFDALVDMGADPRRLILEEESSNTLENFQNSIQLMPPGERKKPLVVITSEFHQRRARYIAEGLGLETIPVSGHTDLWFYRVNYTLREAFALAHEMMRRPD